MVIVLQCLKVKQIKGTTTQPPSSDDNNKPTKPKLPKEGDILELEPQTDDSTKQSKKD